MDAIKNILFSESLNLIPKENSTKLNGWKDVNALGIDISEEIIDNYKIK